MELRKEEYEFLVIQHKDNKYSRNLVGRHCKRIEDIVLPFGNNPLGTTNTNI